MSAKDTGVGAQVSPTRLLQNEEVSSAYLPGNQSSRILRPRDDAAVAQLVVESDTPNSALELERVESSPINEDRPYVSTCWNAVLHPQVEVHLILTYHNLLKQYIRIHPVRIFRIFAVGLSRMGHILSREEQAPTFIVAI